MKKGPGFLSRRAILKTVAGLATVSLCGVATGRFAHADTLDTVRQSGIIRIAVPQDYAPFGSVGPDMQLRGYDVEVAKLIAAGLHVKLQMVPVSMANKIPYLVSNKVDVVLNLGNNAERAKVIDFTQPYAPYYIGVFGPHDSALPDLAALGGKSISVVTSSTDDLLITKNAPANTIVQRFQDNSSAVSAFLSGKTEFLATGNIVGAALLANNPDRHYAQKLLLMNSPVCAAVRKNDVVMLAAVNHVFAGLKQDGVLQRLSLEWLKQPLEASAANGK